VSRARCLVTEVLGRERFADRFGLADAGGGRGAAPWDSMIVAVIALAA
jgi:hypothetical protein